MERPRWWFDELAHAGREHLDAAYAAAFDRKSQLDVAHELAWLQRVGLTSSSTLVDLGAGTGTIALEAARHCRRVVAVDVSAQMLAVLEERLARERVANVDVMRAGFPSYEHATDAPDVVYSRNALHHLADFWKGVALERVAALLPRGGAFLLRDLVFSFEPYQAAEAIEAWLSRAAPRADEGWTRQELEEHLQSEHSTFSWLLEAMLERAGFEIEEVETRAHVYAAYTCRRR